MTSEEEE